MIYSRHFYKISFTRDKVNDISDWWQSNPYSQSKGFGYLIHKNTRLRCEGKFVKEVKFIEIIKTPSGEQIELDRIAYETFEFILNKKYSILILINPPRNLSSFWSTISNDELNQIQQQRIIVKTTNLINELINKNVLSSVNKATISRIQLNDNDFIESVYFSKTNLIPQLETLKLLSKVKSARILIQQDSGQHALISSSASGVISSSIQLDQETEETLLEIASQLTNT